MKRLFLYVMCPSVIKALLTFDQPLKLEKHVRDLGLVLFRRLSREAPVEHGYGIDCIIYTFLFHYFTRRESFTGGESKNLPLTCEFVPHSVDNLNSLLVQCLRLYQAISDLKTHTHRHTQTNNTGINNYWQLQEKQIMPCLFQASLQLKEIKVDLSPVSQQHRDALITMTARAFGILKGKTSPAKRKSCNTTNNRVRLNKQVTHWKSGWTRALWSLLSYAWSLRGQSPRGPLQTTAHSRGLKTCTKWETVKQLRLCGVNAPTDCPAVYELVLVRERLVPLVFAVGGRGPFFNTHTMLQYIWVTSQEVTRTSLRTGNRALSFNKLHLLLIMKRSDFPKYAVLQTPSMTSKSHFLLHEEYVH